MLSRRQGLLPKTESPQTRLLLVGLVLSLQAVAPVFGEQAGKAWAPNEPVRILGFKSLASPRLDVTDAGHPEIVLAASPDSIPQDWEWVRAEWADSNWVAPAVSGLWGGAGPEHVPSLRKARYMVYQVFPQGVGQLVKVAIAELPRTGFGQPDTSMTIFSDDADYAAAVSNSRTWIAKVDQAIPGYNLTVRVAFSDTPGVWHEVRSHPGIDEQNCTLAPLADRSAILVYSGRSGLAWARLDDTTWVESGVLDARPWVAAHPRFRLRPSGGWWLTWADNSLVHLYLYDGDWSSIDSTYALHPLGEQFLPSWAELPYDSIERPPIVWGDVGNSRDVISIAFPSAGGWEVGQEIPNSGGWFPPPTVAEDANGDVWVGWRLTYTGTVLLTHTYTRASVEFLRVNHRARALGLHWRLSEPAPGTWWSVMRARGGEPAEVIARVQAGSSEENEWVDSTAPLQGVVAYQLRRECLDSRYIQTSVSVRWPPGTARPTVLRPTPMPARNEISMEIADAPAGPVGVMIYDVQGRLAWQARIISAGNGRDVLRVGLGPGGASLDNGIYFVRAVDSRGEASNTVKVIVLR